MSFFMVDSSVSRPLIGVQIWHVKSPGSSLLLSSSGLLFPSLHSLQSVIVSFICNTRGFFREGNIAISLTRTQAFQKPTQRVNIGFAQEPGNFFSKWPDSKYFRLFSLHYPCCNYSSLPMQFKNSHRKFTMDRYCHMSMKLYLQNEMATWNLDQPKNF